MSASKDIAKEPVTKNYFVYAQMLSVGGVFRNYERGKFLRPVEVAKLRTIQCGKNRTMFDELLEKNQIGIGYPDSIVTTEKKPVTKS